jgi:hypothetical protein
LAYGKVLITGDPSTTDDVINVIGSSQYEQTLELWKERIGPMIRTHRMKLYLVPPPFIDGNLRHLDFVLTDESVNEDLISMGKVMHAEIRDLFHSTNVDIQLVLCETVLESEWIHLERIDAIGLGQ